MEDEKSPSFAAEMIKSLQREFTRDLRTLGNNMAESFVDVKRASAALRMKAELKEKA